MHTAAPKKKKVKPRKTKNAQAAGSSIPPPLPHSTVNYDKFNFIEDSDEEDPACSGYSTQPVPGCDCAQCISKRRADGMVSDCSDEEEEEEIVDLPVHLPHQHSQDSAARSTAQESGQGVVRTERATQSSAGTGQAQQDKPRDRGQGDKAKATGFTRGFLAPKSTSKAAPDTSDAAKVRQTDDAKSQRKDSKPSSSKGTSVNGDDAASLPSLVTDDEDLSDEDLSEEGDSMGDKARSSEEEVDIPYNTKQAPASPPADDFNFKPIDLKDLTSEIEKSLADKQRRKEFLGQKQAAQSASSTVHGMKAEALNELSAAMGLPMEGLAPQHQESMMKLMDLFFREAKMAGADPLGADARTGAGGGGCPPKSQDNLFGTSSTPWPGVQAQEEPVKKYAYSVRHKVISEETAEKLRRSLYVAPQEPAKDSGKGKNKKAAKQADSTTAKNTTRPASAEPKKNDEPAKQSPIASAGKAKGTKAKSEPNEKEQALKNFHQNRAMMSSYGGSDQAADKIARALVEEEERQKEEEKKKQAEREEAKRAKRKQKQQKKKDRLKASHQQADDQKDENDKSQHEPRGGSEASSSAGARDSAASKTPTAPSPVPTVATPASSLDENLSEEIALEEHLSSKLRKKAKLEATPGPAKFSPAVPATHRSKKPTEPSQVPSEMSTQQEKPESSQQGKANEPSAPERAEQAAGPSKPQSETQEQPAGSPVTPASARDPEEGKGSSNPFSILSGSQEAIREDGENAKGEQAAQPGRKRLLEVMREALSNRKNDLQHEWQKQPFPSPSGYAPGPLIAQARTAWTGLEQTISSAEAAPLCEAVAKVEDWLSTQAKSKVFAVFNAEIKIRAEQAKQILKSKHGVSEPMTLVRPAPPSTAIPGQHHQGGVPLRPVPQWQPPGQGPRRTQALGAMGRGGRQPPYFGGRGRGPPPPAYMATGVREPTPPAHQWESTSVADLDPFGGVPSRAPGSGVSQGAPVPFRGYDARANGGFQRPYAHPTAAREPRHLPHDMGRGRPAPPRPMRMQPPAANFRLPLDARPAAPESKPPASSFNPPPPAPPLQIASPVKTSQFEEEEEGQTCVICMEWPPEIILHPCGHNNMCENCAISVKNLNEGLCPTCRCKIESIIRPR